MKKLLVILSILIFIAFTAPCFAQQQMLGVLARKNAGGVVEYTKYVTNNTDTFNSIAYDAGNMWTGVNDTQLAKATPATNSNAAATLGLSNYSEANISTATIVFTGLSNIPATATVKSITLGYYVSHAMTTTSSITSHRLLLNHVVTEETWNIYSTGNNWNTAGAAYNDLDRSSTVSNVIATGTTTGWKTTGVLEAGQLMTDVQNFIDGGNSNYGWVIYMPDAPADEYLTITSSDGTDGQRPYLKIIYDN